jgi:hypothetical protein
LGNEEEGQLDAATVEKQLKSLKWHLWHGNVYQVLPCSQHSRKSTGRFLRALSAIGFASWISDSPG